MKKKHIFSILILLSFLGFWLYSIINSNNIKSTGIKWKQKLLLKNEIKKSNSQKVVIQRTAVHTTTQAS